MKTVSSPRSRWNVVRSIARKDILVEWNSRVLTNQVAPFALVVMIMFAFALDNEGILQRVAPGLVWLATLFSMLVVVQRSFAVETADGALDALRVAGVSPSGIFFGKSLALMVQLFILQTLLMVVALVLYNVEISAVGVIEAIVTMVAATCGLAFVGTLYGGLAAGARGRETLLPLLLLPVVAPVLIGATRATEAAFETAGTNVSEGWAWIGLLGVFAVVFGAVGSVAFGPLIDE
jgi:heme exporter protein B